MLLKGSLIVWPKIHILPPFYSTSRRSKQFGFPLTSIVFFGYTMEVNGNQFFFTKFFKTSFMFNRRNLYRFGTTWGWGKNDKIYIFGWSVSFRAIQKWENFLYNILNYVQFTCKYLSIQRVDRTWIRKWSLKIYDFWSLSFCNSL